MAEGQRRRVLDTGFGTNLLSALTGSVTEQLQKKRQAEQELKAVFAKVLLEEELKNRFDPERKIGNLITGLLPAALRTAPPTEAEQEAAVPPGTLAVEGPEGGVVLGQGEAAPGFDISSTLRGRQARQEAIGLPRATAELGQQQEAARSTLEYLRGFSPQFRGVSEFPSTATQRNELQVSQDFEGLREAVSQGTITAEEAVSALIQDHPELARSRGKLLEELAIAVGVSQPANVRR